MPKLFISYRRKSWSFTHRLADELSKRLDAEIFVDFTGVDEDDFERSILRNLRESDAMLLVISEHTFVDRIHKDNDWVRREIREALTHHIPTVLVAIEGQYPPPGLPDDIKDIARKQGINFYPDYFSAAVEKLTDFIVKIGAANKRQSLPVATSTTQKPKPANSTAKPPEPRETLAEALKLLDAANYDKAIFLLETLRQQKYKSRYVDVADLLAQAQSHQTQAQRRAQALEDYEEVALLAGNQFTREQARQAWQQWCDDYPDLVDTLDTNDYRDHFKPTPRIAVTDILPPPFAWMTIPAGDVTLVTEKDWVENYIPKGESRTFQVPAFQIAKYPITNAQYRVFVQAGGYNKRQYWTDAGWQQREADKWTQPRYWDNDKFNGDDKPVVGVSWYECVAFCNWLNETAPPPTGRILLPTEQQWQRAAQGDDGRAYPWGDDWDCQRCNNSVSPCDSNATTPVTQYEGTAHDVKGNSPYGVVDMAGNVWEWCLTAYETGETDVRGTDVRRILRGGSWYGLNTDDFRVAFRDWSYPHDRDVIRGFRISLS